MSNTVIKVEGVSKQYRLGKVGTGTITQDLNRWWHTVRGKEDPFLKIGETNDRTQTGASDFVWALKDINFDVKAGEVLGIIGRNGAGKSTLLKILSRTTSPSTGSIKIKGRVASLLEVGTGFHPELSGRENIFLNGAILGMNRSEIKSKFDEIVDFAGVERYIDTPVKRYSSGMYVRLAFAVAAHLEPEILIVDEVLAVGDAEFQKKCLGKMKDVSVNNGRTVLFVSHNMGAIKSLCDKIVILNNGAVSFNGGCDAGIKKYIDNTSGESNAHYIKDVANDKSGIAEMKVINDQGLISDSFGFNDEVTLVIKVKIDKTHLIANLGFRVIDNLERIVFTTEKKVNSFINSSGTFSVDVKIPSGLLVPNKYRIFIALHIPNQELITSIEDIVSFEILETGTHFSQYEGNDYGSVFVDCKWSLIA